MHDDRVLIEARLDRFLRERLQPALDVVPPEVLAELAADVPDDPSRWAERVDAR